MVNLFDKFRVFWTFRVLFNHNCARVRNVCYGTAHQMSILISYCLNKRLYIAILHTYLFKKTLKSRQKIQKIHWRKLVVHIEWFYISHFGGPLKLAVWCEPRLQVEDRTLTYNGLLLQIVTWRRVVSLELIPQYIFLYLYT